MKILVIDLGGTNIKVMATGREERVKIPSGREMTPEKMVAEVNAVTKHWKFDAISLGYPGPVIHGEPAVEPANLGHGWVGFNYEERLGKRVRIINDAAMQALGCYNGGRMLFLGLGTGLGSALVLDGIIVPLELGELRYSKTKNLEDVLGRDGLKRIGRKQWESVVHEVVEGLRRAFMTDCLVLGGGNSKKLRRLPPGARGGDPASALQGGEWLWKRSGLTAKQQEHVLLIA